MRVIVSAGGTGGHIYPALAIINKIKEEEPNSEILYIGTHNRMEKDIVPSYGIKYEPITITGFKRKLTFDNIKTVSNFFKAIKKCKKIIAEFNPDVVIGCGGYVTAPVVYAAKKLGKKTFIHEQNSSVGLSNKFLSRYADKIGVSFSSTVSLFDKDKVVLTGNPCSENAIKVPKKSLSEYGLNDNEKTVLIVMGSLGSKTVNDKILSNIHEFKNKSYQVLMVVGNSYYDKMAKKILPKNIKIVPYINELPGIMKSVSLMVSRSGASTISEITALNIPTIFIPSPYVTNNHQYKNAMDLVNKRAALIIEENNLDINSLVKTIDDVLTNSDEYNLIKKNLKKLVIKDSSTRIYETLKELILNDKRFF